MSNIDMTPERMEQLKTVRNFVAECKARKLSWRQMANLINIADHGYIVNALNGRTSPANVAKQIEHYRTRQKNSLDTAATV